MLKKLIEIQSHASNRLPKPRHRYDSHKARHHTVDLPHYQLLKSQSQAEIVPEYPAPKLTTAKHQRSLHFSLRKSEAYRIEKENEKIAKKILEM